MLLGNTSRPVNRGVMPLHVFKDCESNIMSKLAKYLFILLYFVAGVSVVAAQNSAPSNEASPTSCEQNSATIDQLRYMVTQGENKDSFVIAVARLGKGETSRELSRRRLYNLGTYWKEHRMPAERLILAEGERVGGSGRVELYVSGKLFDRLVARRGKDVCVACCGDDDRYYPLRGLRRRRR